MKRGSISKSRSRLINLWIPNPLLPLIDQAVEIEDTDRSKFIRNAIREKIDRIPPEKVRD